MEVGILQGNIHIYTAQMEEKRKAMNLVLVPEDKKIQRFGLEWKSI